jgi:AcrR family transcriptional regulator
VIGETSRYHLVDQVIDERASEPPRQTRAQQRTATRRAIVDAAQACLVEEGYGALTTRRVAERAGIAQSTVMHHFETRDALIVETVVGVALQLAERALATIDLDALRTPEHREAVLDEAWREFTSPLALAAAQLWCAAWIEPELGPILRELEDRIGAIVWTTANVLFPDQSGDSRFPALIDAAVSLIRGLVMGIPISGAEAVDRRWERVKPLILASAAELIDRQPV